jgi:hypothetical protein
MIWLVLALGIVIGMASTIVICILAVASMDSQPRKPVKRAVRKLP